MKVSNKKSNMEGIKVGDQVILNYQLEGTVEYVSKMGYVEVLFKTKCGGGYLPVELKEITKIK